LLTAMTAAWHADNSHDSPGLIHVARPVQGAQIRICESVRPARDEARVSQRVPK
jgi:hypothetical protein